MKTPCFTRHSALSRDEACPRIKQHDTDLRRTLTTRLRPRVTPDFELDVTVRTYTIPDMSPKTSEAGHFQTTHWSWVEAVRDTDSVAGQEAFEHLCGKYRFPCYAYFRSRGFSPHDADDRTQDFLTHLTAKRRLPSFWNFSEDDTKKEMQSFTEKLRRSRDEVSVYIREQRLRDSSRRDLAKWHGLGTPIPDVLRAELVADLDAMIAGRSIWQEARFARVSIREQTRQLITCNATGWKLARLNRLLLEDSYPELPKRSFRSWIRNCLSLRSRSKPKPLEIPLTSDLQPLEQEYSSLELSPDTAADYAFARGWAATNRKRVMDCMLREKRIAGWTDEKFLTVWKRLRVYTEIEGCSVADDAAKLNMTPDALRKAVYDLRKAFGDELRRVVAETVGDPLGIDAEIRDLVLAIENQR